MVKEENLEKGKMGESEKQDLLRQSEISLILDTYDDIFSDFDPRPYNQRAISHDLLEEANRAVRNTPKGDIQLKFMVPSRIRILQYENLIKKRLKDHFAHHYQIEQENLKKIKWQGAKWFAVGIAFMMFATFIHELTGFWFNLLTIISEPAGWFSFWEGLGKIFIVAEEKSPSLKFYERMSRAEILFMSY